VNYGADGRPHSLKYDRISIYTLEIVKQHQAALESIASSIQIADDGGVSINKLAVQSLVADHATFNNGIKIKDKTTGEWYCAYVDNGQWQQVKGSCSDVAPVVESAPSPQPEQNPAPVEES